MNIIWSESFKQDPSNLWLSRSFGSCHLDDQYPSLHPKIAAVPRPRCLSKKTTIVVSIDILLPQMWHNRCYNGITVKSTVPLILWSILMTGYLTTSLQSSCLVLHLLHIGFDDQPWSFIATSGPGGSKPLAWRGSKQGVLFQWFQIFSWHLTCCIDIIDFQKFDGQDMLRHPPHRVQSSHSLLWSQEFIDMRKWWVEVRKTHHL